MGQGCSHYSNLFIFFYFKELHQLEEAICTVAAMTGHHPSTCAMALKQPFYSTCMIESVQLLWVTNSG